MMMRISDELKDVIARAIEMERELDEKRRLAESWRTSAEGTGREIVKMRERAERAERLLNRVLAERNAIDVGPALYEAIASHFDPATL